MSCGTGCYNPSSCGPSSCGPSSCGPPLSCGVGSCYRPQVNCWGPAYNVKCTQTIFCGCGGCGTSSGVSVNVSIPNPDGIPPLTPNGSCTEVWELSIQGSGLSIISTCNPENTVGNTNTAIAGLICSCPNNFTTTATLRIVTGPANTSIYNGCMSWCICGCNVCGSGNLSGGVAPNQGKATISVQGCCYSNCGTRTICINSIIVAASS